MQLLSTSQKVATSTLCTAFKQNFVDSAAAFTLCALAGLLFILLYAFWCCVIYIIRGIGMDGLLDCCTKSDLSNNRNYSSLTCAFWIVTVLFMSIATALVTNILGVNGVNELEIVCQSTVDLFCLEVAVAALMWLLILLFACCNVSCYFVCIRHFAGDICGRCN